MTKEQAVQPGGETSLLYLRRRNTTDVVDAVRQPTTFSRNGPVRHWKLCRSPSWPRDRRVQQQRAGARQERHGIAYWDE